jgi:Rv0078B-related antitoxin
LSATERLATALELTALAEDMLRQRIRRSNPSLDEREVEARVGAWPLARPGAEFGDGEGVPVPWPRGAPR